MSNPVTPLAITAYHEAGHVVMYLEHGVPFSHVTIVADDATDSLGMVHPSPVTPYLHRATAAEIIAAGPVAECIFDAMGCGADPEEGDLVCAVLMAADDPEVAKAESVGFIVQTLERTVTDVVAVLRRRWADVERLAAALLVADTLTYEQVKEVLR